MNVLTIGGALFWIAAIVLASVDAIRYARLGRWARCAAALAAGVGGVVFLRTQVWKEPLSLPLILTILAFNLGGTLLALRLKELALPPLIKWRRAPRPKTSIDVTVR